MNENGKGKYRVVYDCSKRTKGGIVDALFLVGIIMTAGLWLMLLIFGR